MHKWQVKFKCTEPVFVNLLRSPWIDSQPGGTERQPYFFDVLARQATQAGGIDPLETISGLLKRLQIRAQYLGGRKYETTADLGI